MTRGMWARLKAQLAQDDDAVVAALLGMSLDELREQLGRGIFPDDLVIALASARPDLGLDYRAIMTGEPAEKNAPDDGAKGEKTMQEKQRRDVLMTLDEPFRVRYDLITGTIVLEGSVPVQTRAATSDEYTQPPRQSHLPKPDIAPQVCLSLTPQATTVLLKEIERLLKSSRDILRAADDGSPSDATH